MSDSKSTEELRHKVGVYTESVFWHSIALRNGMTHQDAADAIMKLLDQELARCRKQTASDIFNLAHDYAQKDKTMIGSEDLRNYHYFNAIHKIGEFDGR